mmetsp:Transcript_128903/g.372945  ORF Transcript_128903/g.372945 Transcript_128903/m.372945 type:complete len:229 (-) Transcript_128903:69-755(-)
MVFADHTWLFPLREMRKLWLDDRGRAYRSAVPVLCRHALQEARPQCRRAGGERSGNRTVALRGLHAAALEWARDELCTDPRECAVVLVPGGHCHQPEAPHRLPTLRPDLVGNEAALRGLARAVWHAPARRELDEGAESRLVRGPIEQALRIGDRAHEQGAAVADPHALPALRREEPLEVERERRVRRLREVGGVGCEPSRLLPHAGAMLREALAAAERCGPDELRGLP